MMYYGQKNVEVLEYQRTTVTTKQASLIKINSHSNLNIKGWSLALALARTICTKHLDSIELYYDTIQSFFSLPLIIDLHSSNLRLKSNRLKRLRDFSRTNKIGELGQAIMWLYFVENSSYPYITDFAFFCEKNGINILRNSSTPDFVAQDLKKTTNICLVEAKGKELKSQSSLKSKLKIGLNQCKIGQQIIQTQSQYKVIKNICFCSVFSTESETTNTKLHFVDPAELSNQNTVNDFIYRAHYASWFYLIGDFSNAENLTNGKSITFDTKLYTEKLINGELFWTVNLFERIIDTLVRIESPILYHILLPHYMGDRKVKIGIADKVVKTLVSDTITEFELFTTNSESIDIIFRDGTIITDIDEDKNKTNR